MDEQVAMCVLRERKQKAFDEVCHAFRASENMTIIANEVGMSPTMLRNKLNPEQPHVLSPVELLLITKASGNHTLINSLLLDLGVVTVGFNKEGNEEQTLAARALANSVYSGDLAQQAIDLGGTRRLTRTHKQKLIKTAQNSISNLVHLITDLENRTTGVTPFLSMGVDFIANGAPIPGLS